ncbi:MAG: diaminopimelate epimerase [Solirubrobacterales bacterium]
MTVIAFEKWQALGNDALIVAAERLSRPISAGEVRALCHRHFGVGADGVLLLSPPNDPGVVADLRIFNPDGSEAELSGNGAREAIMSLHRRGWTDRREFSIQTIAGEIRPTILDDTRCRVDMGRASLRSAKDFPSGGADGRGEVAGHAFQFVSIGNPQCAIATADPDALDLPAIGPSIERSPLFPNRTNASFYAPLDAHAIRARIFERGVGETLSSGTGATGAAVAHVLRGGRSPVTVRLDGGELAVEVGDDLHVHLTGWAVPVFRGEIDLDSQPYPDSTA